MTSRSTSLADKTEDATVALQVYTYDIEKWVEEWKNYDVICFSCIFNSMVVPKAVNQAVRASEKKIDERIVTFCKGM